jgi:glycosyltransferase involved in cell wall biosynthesis
MKALLVPPTNHGGLFEQFQQTAQALAQQGVDIRMGDADTVAPDEIVHLFDAPDIFGALAQFLYARARGARVVVNPLYWNPTRFLTQGLAGIDEPTGAQAELERRVRAAQSDAECAARRVVFRYADALLPLSTREASLLAQDFDVPRERMVVAPNGIDPLFTRAHSGEAFATRHGVRDFVLCAARMDALKNQLRLIQALAQESLTLVLIGRAESEDYLARCRQAAHEAQARVLFLPALAREELAQAYAAARVHALVSWYDVAPLAALEAAAMGCRIVLTQESGGSDYFGQDAWYCDPGDLTSIRNAVRAAYAAPRTNTLRERIARECTWERAAKQTRGAYELALAAPRAQSDAYLSDVEHALNACAALVKLQAEARARTWQEKESLARVVNAYANGRVMRALNALSRMLKRG